MTDDKEDVDFLDDPWYVFYINWGVILAPFVVIAILVRVLGWVPW